MIRRSVFLSLLAVGLEFCLMSGSTYAYFTDTQSAVGRLETGTVKIAVSAVKNKEPREGCDAEPGCGDGRYLARWNVKNTGSLPVYLYADVEENWQKKRGPPRLLTGGKKQEEDRIALSGEKPGIVAGDVFGWTLNDGRYSYTQGGNGGRMQVLGPKHSVTFSLPFDASGPDGAYSLKLCLKVRAVQAAAGAIPSVDGEESEESEEDAGATAS